MAIHGHWERRKDVYQAGLGKGHISQVGLSLGGQVRESRVTKGTLKKGWSRDIDGTGGMGLGMACLLNGIVSLLHEGKERNEAYVDVQSPRPLSARF